jgi:hypothetical protein
MRRNRFLGRQFALVLTAAGVLLAPASGQCATALRLDLPALMDAANLVVRGTVDHASCRLTDTGRIVTDTVVRVDEALAGDAGGDTVVVTTLGGVIGDRGQRVSGSPMLQAGDEVVLFLRRPGPVSSVSRTSVVGLAQGAFHVQRWSGRPLLVRHLDGMVLQGIDAVPVPEDLDVLRESIRALLPAGGVR